MAARVAVLLYLRSSLVPVSIGPVTSPQWVDFLLFPARIIQTAKTYEAETYFAVPSPSYKSPTIKPKTNPLNPSTLAA
ncbi:hypothetical protein TNCV_1485931 [Trichonephila clavipes]|nr:hypothetical protein TNCV_1485931 [Trichonephila clavipes]